MGPLKFRGIGGGSLPIEAKKAGQPSQHLGTSRAGPHPAVLPIESLSSMNAL
jgi:hypothetical protein